MTANALKPKVLVVDDDQGARSSLSRLVAKAGCKAHAVASSGEAIQALSEIPFDAVITDLQLSDAGGGISVLRHVHQLKVDLPVMIVTGAPSFDTAQAAVEWGAFFYACKPYDPVALIERIRMAVSRSRDKFKRNVDLLERLHRELTDAIGSLHMAYQPIVMSDKVVYGYEALMRTRSDTLPNPMVLLDRAVELLRIPEIGRKVRRLVAADMEQGAGTMFVNLHPSELQDDDLFDPQAPLSRFSERVVLELTERASLTDIPAFQERVDRLRRMGFRVAIDDVGAGYSSLNSIAMLAPDVVKIDMALCAGVSTDPVKQRLLRSMVSAFRELGSLVVAEGVETPDDFAELQGVRCDLFQGYLFAKPGPAYPMVA